MERISFSDALGFLGIILAIVLLVLDKAGKVKGGLLIVLLCLAGLMTLFLAVGNGWVLDAPSKWKVWRGGLMITLVAFSYSGLAIWISGGRTEESVSVEAPKGTQPVPSLGLNAYIPPTDPYPENTKFAGLIWHARYVDVRIDLVNGPVDIEDVDFRIMFDTSIAGIGQVSEFPGVTIFPAQDMPLLVLHGTDTSGIATSLPVAPMPGGGRIAPLYRVRCAKLFANSTMHLAVATVTTNPAVAGKMPDSLFAPRKAPKNIQVEGTYVFAGKSFPLKMTKQFL